tara:strand:- start:5744 stop:6256 length:513 start_codon:yes stop_codon:yes gene_type:complete
VNYTGKQFEDVIARWARSLGVNGSVGRYGVQAVHTGGDRGIVAIKSLPDFEGILTGSTRQYIWDCKVCSQASFDLGPYRDKKKRQLQHMLDRSRFGASCAFLIHWNRRELKTKVEPGITYWFPVSEAMPFWRDFQAAEVRRITREDCYCYGTEVGWAGKKPLLLQTLLKD